MFNLKRFCNVRFLWVVFIFLNLQVHSQDTAKKHLFYLGPLLSPDYSSAFLTNGNPRLMSYDHWYDSQLQPKLSFTGGLDLLYQWSQNFSLSLGVQYSIKDGMTNVGPANSGYEDTWVKHDVAYLDLPVKIDFYLTKKKTRPYLSAGVSPNLFLFWSDNWLQASDRNRPDFAPSPSKNANGFTFSSVNPQLQIGMGLDINPKKRNRFRAEALFRYSILPANTSPYDWLDIGLESNELDCSRRFYSFGLALSYLWGL